MDTGHQVADLVREPLSGRVTVLTDHRSQALDLQCQQWSGL